MYDNVQKFIILTFSFLIWQRNRLDTGDTDLSLLVCRNEHNATYTYLYLHMQRKV